MFIAQGIQPLSWLFHFIHCFHHFIPLLPYHSHTLITVP